MRLSVKILGLANVSHALFSLAVTGSPYPLPDVRAITNIRITRDGISYLCDTTDGPKEVQFRPRLWSYFLARFAPAPPRSASEVLGQFALFWFDFEAQALLMMLDTQRAKHKTMLITLAQLRNERPDLLAHPMVKARILKAMATDDRLRQRRGRPAGSASRAEDREALEIAETLRILENLSITDAIDKAIELRSLLPEQAENLQRMGRRRRAESAFEDEIIEELKRTYIPAISGISA